MTANRWMLSSPVRQDFDHIRGPLDATVTLLQYGDYECELSASAHPIVLALETRLGRSLRFVYRHCPNVIHPHAQEAAEAAEAAGAQGNFWGMHDLLFENQRGLCTDKLLALAQRLGLDVETFARDLRRHVHVTRIRQEVESALKSGVNRTPAFYINGEQYEGDCDLNELLSAITRAAIEKQS